MKDTIYLVIQCGFEGIEGLLFGSTDGDKAVTFLKARRMDIAAAKGTNRKNLKGDQYELLHVDPASLCIQKSVEKGFECCCEEFKVQPNKKWLY